MRCSSANGQESLEVQREMVGGNAAGTTSGWHNGTGNGTGNVPVVHGNGTLECAAQWECCSDAGRL